MVLSSIKTSKDMKRFIGKTILFALLFTVAMAALAVVNKRYFFANNYLNEFPVKKQLIRDTPSPKVVVIGGSNVAFGIDSKTLSDSLGMPVVNAGLHAGLGLRYILDANTPYLRKGDILVIMPEYSHFFDTGAWGSSGAMAEAPLFATKNELLSFNLQQLSIIARYFCHKNVQIFVNAIRPSADSPTYQYLKSGFDARGDEISHRVKQSGIDMTHHHSVPSFTALNEEYLSEFISDVREMRQRGIRVILLPPAILDSSLAADRPMIDSIAQRLQAAGIPYQASLDTFAYTVKYLYDTNYHLNAEGTKVNTRNVLNVLGKTLH